MSKPPLEELIEVYKKDDTKICLFTGAGVSFTEADNYRVAGGWWGILRKIHLGIQQEYHPEKGQLQADSEFNSLRTVHSNEWDMANALEATVNDYADRSGKEKGFVEFVWDAVIPFQSRARKQRSKNLPNKYLVSARTLNAVIAFCSRLKALHAHPCLELNDKVKAIITPN